MVLEKAGLPICYKIHGNKKLFLGIIDGITPGYMIFMILMILIGIELMKKQERTMTGAGTSNGFLILPGRCMLFQ
jgi:hypothetical protein